MDEKEVKTQGQAPAQEMSLNDQEQARQAKLAKYVELGVDPFGQRYAWKDRIIDIRKNMAN
jgi:lysyl-tRNA synthetase class II